MNREDSDKQRFMCDKAWVIGCFPAANLSQCCFFEDQNFVGDTAMASARAAHPVTAAKDPDSERGKDVLTKFFFCLLVFTPECIHSSLNSASMVQAWSGGHFGLRPEGTSNAGPHSRRRGHG